MNRMRFVEAEKAQHHNVAKACELLEVSRSAFYDFARHQPSAPRAVRTFTKRRRRWRISRRSPCFTVVTTGDCKGMS